MRGEKTEQPNQEGPLIVPASKSNRFVAANIIDPNDGTVQFHIVSTKWFNVLVAVVVTLFLCGIVVLGLIVFLKLDVDRNKEQLEQLRQEEVTNVNS